MAAMPGWFKLPIELGIGGLADQPQATLADEGGHVVMAESGADF